MHIVVVIETVYVTLSAYPANDSPNTLYGMPHAQTRATHALNQLPTRLVASQRCLLLFVVLL